MRKVRCDRCNSHIKKVVCGTLFCAKTNPIRKITLREGEIVPDWLSEEAEGE